MPTTRRSTASDAAPADPVGIVRARADALYRAANERFLGMDEGALADWLVTELERAGVAERRDGALVAR